MGALEAARPDCARFVGGCVRDRLLGLEPVEYDVATDAVPDQVRAVFPGARMVGESFGVMLVRSHGHVIEVATFRTDGASSDHRRPDSVVFTDEREDVKRRDFTINALALKLNKDGELTVQPFDTQDSSMLAVFSNADCLAVRPPFAEPAKAGDRVEIIRLDPRG